MTTEPMNLQLVGRAFDDPKLLGYAYAYAYAYDQVKQGHVETDKAPALAFQTDPTPPVVTEPRPVPPVTGPQAILPRGPLALTATMTVEPTQRLATVRAKGLGVVFRVNQAAALKAEVRVSAATAGGCECPRSSAGPSAGSFARAPPRCACV